MFFWVCQLMEFFLRPLIAKLARFIALIGIFVFINPSICFSEPVVADVHASDTLKSDGGGVPSKWTCDATGERDSTTCIQAELNRLSGGGRLQVFGKFLILRDLTIPPGVSFEGNCLAPGTNGSNTAIKYANSTCGVLRVSANASIHLSAGASIRSMQLFRAGMTFPTTSSKSFLGTAIKIVGDDARIDRVTVLGFDRAVYDNGFQRPSINALYGDNNNGIELTQVYDVARITNCHMWPFSTIASKGDFSKNQRSGIAYYLHDTVDGPVLVGNFAYGYKTSFEFSNVSTVSAVNNVADNTGRYVNSIGWEFSGNLNGFSGAGNSVWSQGVGVSVALSENQILSLVGMIFNHNSIHVDVGGGDVGVYNSSFFNSAKLINISNSDSMIYFNGNFLGNNEVGIFSPKIIPKILIGSDNVDLTPKQNVSLFSGNFELPGVMSREEISLPTYGEVFRIEGSANIKRLFGGWAGRRVELLFDGQPKIYSVSGQNAFFTESDNYFQIRRGAVLDLIFDGSRWFSVTVPESAAVAASPKTVATLPKCDHFSLGTEFMVADAQTPKYSEPLKGGGAVVVKAICNGSEWTAH